MGEEQAPEDENNGKDGGGLVHTSGDLELIIIKTIWIV